MDIPYHAVILLCILIVTFPEDAHGSFKDIIRHAKSVCSLKHFVGSHDVSCTQNGFAVDVTDNVRTGTSCTIKYKGLLDQKLFCLNGAWHSNDPSGRIVTHRVKRGWFRWIVRAIVKVACWIFCRGGRRGGGGGGGRAPPPNRPPMISCPSIGAIHNPESGSTTKIVTWNQPTASDPDGDTVSITQKAGLPSGSVFSEGHHAISYTATDKHGNMAVCTVQFQIKGDIMADATCGADTAHSSGTPDLAFGSCKAHRCSSMPPIPSNGYSGCTPNWYDPILGTTCTFSCDDGYDMIGSSTRTCLSNGNFDGDLAVCSKIQCPNLLTTQNGQAVCSDGIKYNSFCITSCQVTNGYAAMGIFIQCLKDKQWSGQLQPCLDFRDPYFTYCPLSPIKVYAGKGESFAIVTWTTPTATDNSGDVTIDRTMGADSGSAFDVGSQNVNYKATDSSGNEAPTSCSFTVVVEQLECDPPNDKFDDDLILVECPGSDYIYGTVCNVTCKRNYELIGNDSITCERDGTTTRMIWDWGGGAQPLCNDQCPDLTPPTNGALTCATAANYYCRQSCQTGHGYPRGTTASSLFICTDAQLWDPPAVDACTVTVNPGYNSMGGEIHYFTGNCDDPSVQDELKNNFISFMENLIATGWSNVCASSGCSVDDVVVTCGAVARKRRDTSMLKRGQRQSAHPFQYDRARSKRGATDSHVIIIVFHITLPWKDDADLTTNDNFMYAIFDAVSNEIATGTGLNLIGLTPSNCIHDAWPLMVCAVGELPSYFGGGVNCEGCAPGKMFDSTMSDCVKCPIGTYQDESHQHTCKPCPTDTSTREDRSMALTDCIQVCGAGNYSTDGVTPCARCPVGEYQSTKHSTSCTKCDVSMTTIQRGSNSSGNCIGFDVIYSSPGQTLSLPSFTSTMNAFTVMLRLICPAVNIIAPAILFQTSNGATTIFEVMDSEHVNILGSQVVATALAVWKHFTIRWSGTGGQVELLVDGVSGVHTPINLSENLASAGSYMKIAQGSGETQGCRMADFRMTDTWKTDAEIQAEIQTCLPDTTGSIYNMGDFKEHDVVTLESPSKCDAVDECVENNPCGIHPCENLINGYKCSCPTGYTGSQCQYAPDLCIDNKCENGASCQNQESDYTCICPVNYREKLCSEAIVHGNWADWSDWPVCTATCDGGQRSRYRTCTNPPPGPDGNDCSGSGQEQEACNGEACPSCNIVHLLLKAKNILKDTCIAEGSYMRCNITCSPGYVFSPATQPLDYYECGSNTTYIWSGKPPSCGPIRRGSSLTVLMKETYTKNLECSNEMDNALQAVADKASCVTSFACTATVTRNDCETRRKRETGTNVVMSFSINLEGTGDNLNLTALIESNIISADLQTYLDAMSALEETAEDINNTVSNFFDISLNGETYTIDPDTFTINGEVSCPNGSVVDDGACVDCPAGTRQNGDWCVFCDLGTYQSETGQTSCTSCPSGYTTEFLGSLDVTDCSVTVVTTTGSTVTTTTSAPVSTTAVNTPAATTTTTTVPTTTTTTTVPTTTTTTTVPTTTTTTTVPTTTTTTTVPTTTTTTTVPTTATTTTTVPTTTTTTTVPTTTTTTTVPTTTTAPVITTIITPPEATTTTTNVPITTTPIATATTTTTTIPVSTTSAPTTTPPTTAIPNIKPRIRNKDPGAIHAKAEDIPTLTILMIALTTVLVIAAVSVAGTYIYRSRQSVGASTINVRGEGCGVAVNIHANTKGIISEAAGVPAPGPRYPSHYNMIEI